MMAKTISVFRKGVALSLIIALVMIITVATGWVGLHQAEKLTEMHHWVTETGGFWLVWRLGLYAVLGWGSWKIGQKTTHQPAHRAVLIRMRVSSLLFILLGEYALSGNIGGML
ncbi:hypothetical protein [Xenorhabdus ehlersii]|uniref:Exported protein n=1 Tax=Xenorhabdus ehlersii TaxID=290111 RepID=A0A2D0ILZ8_9GAMM|nr:hypothetical protein [Xenorhabdus ehlersii]PHM22842.1 exported protein [Xenorhabdus ehlersii]RKE93144.1 hypothetical protein BDE27_0852 [Xenorhabdus ehlersii]